MSKAYSNRSSNYSQPKLWIAAHETGHAIARLVLNETIAAGPTIWEVSLEADDDSIGHVKMRNRVDRPGAEQLRDARLDIIETFAGPVAELRCHYGRWAPAFSWRDMIPRALAADPGDENDMGDVVWLLDWIAPTDPTAELRRLWFEAVELVNAEWRGLLAMARIMQRDIRMYGDTFEEVWRGLRSARSQVRSRKRADQLTTW
jgi:hypothetical protein